MSEQQLEPRYVQRDKDGVVIGHYAHPQPYAQECVPGDHAEIIAWQEKRESNRKKVSPFAELQAKVVRLEAQLHALLAGKK